MKFFSLITKTIVLIILIIFSLINTIRIPFFYLPSQSIDLPLIIIIFAFFILGSVFGVFALFGRLLRLRNENARLRAEVQKAARLATQDIAAPTPVIQAASFKKQG